MHLLFKERRLKTRLKLQRRIKVSLGFMPRAFIRYGVDTLICIWLLIYASAAFAQQTDFSIRIVPENTLKIQAGDIEPKVLQSPTRLASQVLGRESSECRPNGRQSFSSGTADVKLLETRDDGVSFLHSAVSTAQGGHFRTCAACISGNCIGLSGNDTSAKGASESRALLTIEFDKNRRRGQYFLEVSLAGTGQSPSVTLTDGRGKMLIALADQPNKFTLDSADSDIFYLTTKASATSENKGGCCSETSSNSARVDVRIRKAPLLSSRGVFEPFIKGGARQARIPM
jgi:hypothetical protein